MVWASAEPSGDLTPSQDHDVACRLLLHSEAASGAVDGRKSSDEHGEADGFGEQSRRLLSLVRLLRTYGTRRPLTMKTPPPTQMLLSGWFFAFTV